MNFEITPIGGAIYAVDKNVLGNGSSKQQQPSTPVKDDINTSSLDYIPWFEDNLFPQNLVKKFEKNDVMPRALEINMKACYGQGFQYGYKKTNDKGEVVYIPTYRQEIEDWLAENNLETYLQEAAHDVMWFSQTFPELVPNRKGDKIKYLHEMDATMCRMGKQIEKGKQKGQIKKVHVSANWDTSNEPQYSRDAIDCYHGALAQAKEYTAQKKIFIAPQYKRVNGRVAYELPRHYGIVDSGWLELAELIVKAKKSAIKKNANIGYHIEVDNSYWPAAYPDWDKLTPEKRNEHKKNEAKHFLDQMVGPEGNRLVFTATQERQGKNGIEKYSLWKITELTGSRLENKFLEDTREADHHAMRAAGIHSSQMSSGPGKGFSAGSGAVERVSFNNMVLMLKPEQDRIWWPMNNLVVPINGWNKDDEKEQGKFCFWFTNFFIATLDTGNEVQEGEAS